MIALYPYIHTLRHNQKALTPFFVIISFTTAPLNTKKTFEIAIKERWRRSLNYDFYDGTNDIND
jgi:hypothetical protein